MADGATRDDLWGQRTKPGSEGDRVRPRIRQRLSYANVMSTVAVFIALGGSSYAAVTLSGSDIKHRSIPATKLKRNTLTGLEIRESRLGRVPRAARADRLSDEATDELKVRCPVDMFPSAGTCIERIARRPAAYLSSSAGMSRSRNAAGPWAATANTRRGRSRAGGGDADARRGTRRRTFTRRRRTPASSTHCT